MRIRIEPAAQSLPMPWYGFAALGAFGAFSAVVYWFGRHTGAEWTLCTMKRFTGVPCAGCRGTRAGLRLLAGDLPGAFSFNPLLAMLFVLIPVGLALRIGSRRTLRFELRKGDKIAIAIALVLLFAANWAYVIYMELHASR
ncbi:MAG TPA: DUF2752 domain-containing protein [Verrucomicrobiales bacterium]|nr:DUF2752 domain-containing protein [Verrucomicrobiales bacterium]